MRRRGWPRSDPAPPLSVSRLLRGREGFKAGTVGYTLQAFVSKSFVPFAHPLWERRLRIIVVVAGRVVSSRRGVGEASEGWPALAPLASVAASASVVTSEATSSDLVDVGFFVTEW